MSWGQRWCCLRDLPETPCAVAQDFSEAVRRSRVNFEGVERVKSFPEVARQFRHSRLEIRHGHVASVWRPEETTSGRRGFPTPYRPPSAECLAGLSEATRGRAEDWPGQPPAVRQRLAALTDRAPFNVRFQKDHASVGRVFAFDGAPRPGVEFKLELFAECRCGFGSVYAGALGLAKQVFQDCLRSPGKTVSSGYKYPEYEKHRGSGDWRLLDELFTEAVRFFRHPPAPEALPQQHPPPPSPPSITATG